MNKPDTNLLWAQGTSSLADFNHHIKADSIFAFTFDDDNKSNKFYTILYTVKLVLPQSKILLYLVTAIDRQLSYELQNSSINGLIWKFAGNTVSTPIFPFGRRRPICAAIFLKWINCEKWICYATTTLHFRTSFF